MTVNGRIGGEGGKWMEVGTLGYIWPLSKIVDTPLLLLDAFYFFPSANHNSIMTFSFELSFSVRYELRKLINFDLTIITLMNGTQYLSTAYLRC